MAIAALEIPRINPLRFVAIDGELPRDPRDNIVHFDQDWFSSYIRDWQTKSSYAQKWQFNDRVALYFNANSNFGYTLQLLDCTGRIWKTWTVTDFMVVPGNVIKAGDVVIPGGDADTYVQKFRFSDIGGLPEGIYWLYLSVNYDLNNDAVVDYHRHNISEPLSIATKHPGTTHLDYYHTTSYEDILFPQTGIRFSIRCESDIVDYDINSNDTQYEDGELDPQMLASQVFRTMKYATTVRLPEYMIDILGRAWGCNRITVDSKGVTKEIGAKFAPGRIPKLPKITWIVPIRESNHRASSVQVVSTACTIYTIPSYPFAISSLMLSSSTDTLEFVDQLVPYVIHNGGEHTAMIAALNTKAANDYYLAGTFSVSGSDLVFTNAGNDLVISGAARMYLTPLTYVVAGVLAETISITNGEAIVDWGDGITQRVSSAGSIDTGGHAYSGGSHTISIYGVYNVLFLSDPNLNTLGGKVAAGTVAFTLNGSNVINAINGNIFSDAAPTMQILSIYLNTALSSITNIDTQVFSQCRFFSFAANALTSSACDLMLAEVDNLANTYPALVNGYMYVNGQVPVAHIGTFGAGARYDLVTNYGWLVYYD